MTTKNLISAALFSALLLGFASCGGGAKTNGHGTHTHEDGTVHQDHSVDEATRPSEQESFRVEADSTTCTANPAHHHEDGHTHDHGDGKPHKH